MWEELKPPPLFFCMLIHMFTPPCFCLFTRSRRRVSACSHGHAAMFLRVDSHVYAAVFQPVHTFIPSCFSLFTRSCRHVSAQSAAPVDTMNISLPVLKEAEEGGEEGANRKGDVEEEMEEEMKLMLFPSQIHKLTSLVSLLSHLRDLVQRLIDMAPGVPPAKSFDWRSQLLYFFEEEPRGVTIQVG